MRRLLPFLVLVFVLATAIGCSDKPRSELKNPTGPPPTDSNVPSVQKLPEPGKNGPVNAEREKKPNE